MVSGWRELSKEPKNTFLSSAVPEIAMSPVELPPVLLNSFPQEWYSCLGGRHSERERAHSPQGPQNAHGTLLLAFAMMEMGRRLLFARILLFSFIRSQAFGLNDENLVPMCSPNEVLRTDNRFIAGR